MYESRSPRSLLPRAGRGLNLRFTGWLLACSVLVTLGGCFLEAQVCGGVRPTLKVLKSSTVPLAVACRTLPTVLCKARV